MNHPKGSVQNGCQSAGQRACAIYVPIVISLVALSFTIQQGCLNRQVARFSVRPILQVSFVAAPDSGLSHVGLYISNDGAGVALLDAVTVLSQDELTGQTGAFETLANLLRARNPDFPPILYIAEIAGAIRPGAQKCLLGVAGSDASVEHVATLRNLVSGLSPRIQYHSLYNERFETQSDLD